MSFTGKLKNLLRRRGPDEAPAGGPTAPSDVLHPAPRGGVDPGPTRPGPSEIPPRPGGPEIPLAPGAPEVPRPPDGPEVPGAPDVPELDPRPPGDHTVLQPVQNEERLRMIQEAAYFLAQKRGFTETDHARNWAEAEAQVDAELASGDGRSDG